MKKYDRNLILQQIKEYSKNLINTKDTNVQEKYIYILYDPTFISKKIYIGKTNNPQVRYRDHLKSNVIKRDTFHSNWLRSLLDRHTTPHMFIVQTVPDNITWQELEILYIKFFRDINIETTNGTDGGDGINLTPEIINKIRIANTNKILSPETKLKISESKTGIKLNLSSEQKKVRAEKMHSQILSGKMKSTQISIAKMRATKLGVPRTTVIWNKGIKYTEAQKRNMPSNVGVNNNFYGKFHSKETKEKISQHRRQNPSRAKLNKAEVIQIFKFLSLNTSIKEIHKLFKDKISEDTIRRIKSGRVWNHVLDELDEETRKILLSLRTKENK